MSSLSSFMESLLTFVSEIGTHAQLRPPLFCSIEMESTKSIQRAPI